MTVPFVVLISLHRLTTSTLESIPLSIGTSSLTFFWSSFFSFKSRSPSRGAVHLTRSRFTEPSSETSVSHRIASGDRSSSSSDSDVSASEDYSNPKRIEPQSRASVLVWGAAPVSLLVIVVVMLFYSLFLPSISSDLKADVETQMRQLMETFPNQSNRLWVTVKSALLSQPRFCPIKFYLKLIGSTSLGSSTSFPFLQVAQ